MARHDIMIHSVVHVLVRPSSDLPGLPHHELEVLIRVNIRPDVGIILLELCQRELAVAIRSEVFVAVLGEHVGECHLLAEFARQDLRVLRHIVHLATQTAHAVRDCPDRVATTILITRPWFGCFACGFF